MHRFGKLAFTALVFVVFTLSGPAALAQQRSCCMMGGQGMGMGVMLTLGILRALLLLFATAAFVALAVFLLRRSQSPKGTP